MSRTFVLTLLLLCVSASGASGDTGPGLVLTIESLAGAKPGIPDARISRLVALYVPQGEPPSDFTPAGPFRATFEGDVNLRLRDTYTFFAEGRGKLTLSLNGKPVLESSGDDLTANKSQSVRLNKGKNRLVAIYESPASGDAKLRLFWSARLFQPEPLNPAAFTRPEPSPQVTQSLALRDGRFLFAQLRCAKCHNVFETAMPELAMDAPSLSDAGVLLKQEWMAAWINNPRALRADAHMPRLFNGKGTDPRAADIAAYLATLGKPASEPRQGDVKAGGRLFANLDCIACHTPPDAADDPTRVMLKHVKSKYQPGALREYLLRPEAHYAWNPMPNFRLSEEQAIDLSAFLLSVADSSPPRAMPGDPAKGKLLIESTGCLNCHATGELKSASRAPALAAITSEKLNAGCLGETPAARGSAPDFALDAGQRKALVAFLAGDRASLKRRCAPEFAERQVAAMRCTACHARDGVESPLVQDLAPQSQALHDKYPNAATKEGELWAADQRPPMLTWAGEKLRPQWMREFIAGRVKEKPRYYLHARMPAFAARAEMLATGLAEEHGCSPDSPAQSKPNPELAEAGRKLCSKIPNQGFSCVQCHAVADEPPFAAFEAPAINFKFASDRLLHDYYRRWMHDPLRIDPNTKMPRFDDAEGKTALPVFGGDAARQFEAIWNYLLTGNDIKPPPQ